MGEWLLAVGHDWQLLWLTIVGGLLFGLYVYLKGDIESDWRDILSWGMAVYLTVIGLASLNRVVGGSSVMESFFNSTVRWWAWLFTAMATAGILRWYRNRRLGI